VTKPGGRVVVADTDWATVLGSNPISQAIGEFNGHSIRNPKIGRDLGQLFRASGLQQIRVWPCQLVTAGDELNEEYTQMLQPLVAAAQAAGALTEAEVGTWAETLMRDAREGIGFFILPSFVVAGTKA
jgi:hypothetical protein